MAHEKHQTIHGAGDDARTEEAEEEPATDDEMIGVDFF